MSTERKISVSVSVLYAYAGIQALLLLVGTIGASIDDETMRQIFGAVVHISVIGGVAYLITRKRSKVMYWVSAVIILFELIKKLGSLAFLMSSSNSAVSLGPIGIMLGSVNILIFLIAAILIFQPDVRSTLSS